MEKFKIIWSKQAKEALKDIMIIIKRNHLKEQRM